MPLGRVGSIPTKRTRNPENKDAGACTHRRPHLCFYEIERITYNPGNLLEDIYDNTISIAPVAQ